MNTIIVKSYLNIRDEREAAGTITPGMLLEINSAGKFIAHSDANGPAAKIFAIEDAYQGKKITDDYTSGNRVIAQHFTPGEKVYAILDGDSTNSVVIGDYVKSAGNGKLTKFSEDSGDSGGFSGAGEIIGIAMEAAEGGERFKVLIS